MKRVHTKIGDVFSVKIDENSKKYMQYIASDPIQLSSDVIRAFKQVYPIDEQPNVSEIIKDEIQFYAHCVTSLGIKMGLWEKVDNVKEMGKIDDILFKDTSDYGTKHGEEPVKISQKWYIWKIGDKTFTRVGKLEGEYKTAHTGLIVNPYGIIELLKGNKYPANYPN